MGISKFVLRLRRRCLLIPFLFLFSGVLTVLFSGVLIAAENRYPADTLLTKSPLMIKGNWPSYPLFISDYAVLFEDTLGITHRISRLLNEATEPEGYVSHIETPVCSDTLCNLMDIRVFWSLSGAYWGFDTITYKPLTKNDHLKFDRKDYEKLHELLLDEQSILRRRHKDDLFDKEVKRVSQVVDAVTGATAKEVKEAVVDGAVYSSYTIYHLVHSQLSAVVREDVRKHLWPGVKEKLSKSDKIDERIFFLKELPREEFDRYRDDVLQTITDAVPRDRLYVMKKMPKAMWEEAEVQLRLAEIAGQLDIHSLSQYLNQLKETKQLNLETLQKLSVWIPSFSLNQLKVFLTLIERDPKFVTDAAIQKEVKAAHENTAFVHSPFLKPYLR